MKPKMSIKFSDGHRDIVHLRPYSPYKKGSPLTKDRCAYIGRLKKDREAYASVSGCHHHPERYVTVVSHRHTGQYLIKGDKVISLPGGSEAAL